VEILVLGQATVHVDRAVFLQRRADRIGVQRGIGRAVAAHAQAVEQVAVQHIGVEVGERVALVGERRATIGGVAVGVAGEARAEQDLVDRAEIDGTGDVRLAEQLLVPGLLGEGDAADLASEERPAAIGGEHRRLALVLAAERRVVAQPARRVARRILPVDRGFLAVGARGEPLLGAEIEEIFRILAARRAGAAEVRGDHPVARLPVEHQGERVVLDAGAAEVGVELAGGAGAAAGETGEGRGGDHAVGIGRALEQRALIAIGILGVRQIVVVAADHQRGAGQRQVVGRANLQGAGEADALTLLLEEFAGEERGDACLAEVGDHRRVGQLAIEGRTAGDAAVRAIDDVAVGILGIAVEQRIAGAVPVDRRACAAELFLVVIDRAQEADRVVGIVPAVQRRAAEAAALGTAVILAAAGQRDGVGGEVERLAGDDVDARADGAFLQACLGGLVDDRLADDRRREQRIVERAAGAIRGVAAPVCGGDGMAVDGQTVQRGLDAGDR